MKKPGFMGFYGFFDRQDRGVRPSGSRGATVNLGLTFDGSAVNLVHIEQSNSQKKVITMTAVRKRGGNILHSENPFMVEMTTRTKRVTNKRGDMMLVNNETGEIQSQVVGFWEAHEVDSTKFVKLFIRGVKALKELTGAGTKVFEVLYLRVQESIGKDQIYISFNLVDQAITPMSEATYTRGMRELIEKEFLAASPNIGLYWLNPSFVWNGDRLQFVQEYRKKRDAI